MNKLHTYFPTTVVPIHWNIGDLIICFTSSCDTELYYHQLYLQVFASAHCAVLLQKTTC